MQKYEESADQGHWAPWIMETWTKLRSCHVCASCFVPNTLISQVNTSRCRILAPCVTRNVWKPWLKHVTWMAASCYAQHNWKLWQQRLQYCEQQNNIFVMTVDFDTSKTVQVGAAIIPHHHHCIQNSSGAHPASHPYIVWAISMRQSSLISKLFPHHHQVPRLRTFGALP